MSHVDPKIKALQDLIFLSKVTRARDRPMNEKIADGPLLFDQNMSIMRGAIRSEHPEYTDQQVEKEVDRRLAIAKRIDDGNLYQNVTDE